ncbi:hypothetical protein [Burkholderia ubonensis]|uniref:hypothetical protein n=1 Tax=Burkholderia ubonensis TaxID=101571 RepID=UPI000A401F64|nr:hypothetical protein [Burkholderia ubonensis]
MNTRNCIAEFTIIERCPGYDVANNPLLRTIAELMPVGITWRAGGAQQVVRNGAGIAGRVLGDASGVAIVEAPYDLTANRASIVNADGSLRARLPAAIGVERMAYYDVIEVNGSIAFLADACGRNAVLVSSGVTCRRGILRRWTIKTSNRLWKSIAQRDENAVPCRLGHSREWIRRSRFAP